MKYEIHYNDGRCLTGLTLAQARRQFRIGSVFAEQWDTWGADGCERMPVWTDSNAAHNDDGSRAVAQIVRRP